MYESMWEGVRKLARFELEFDDYEVQTKADRSC